MVNKLILSVFGYCFRQMEDGYHKVDTKNHSIVATATQMSPGSQILSKYTRKIG